jgi:lipopolysaccharide export system permease protein
MKLKQIDRLVLKGFFPPFAMTFFVALFVFIMQFFWKYIDDIVGKGLEISIVFEMIFYLSMSLVPLAFPIAVLISCVMVMGNMGEHYELASLKSAGVSLFRTMAALFVVSILVMVTSFVFADVVIPYSNLKFHTRLYDIQRQKAALNLQEGIFNNDFDRFVIRVGKKGKDNQALEDVMIYDQSKSANNPAQILAQSGKMYANGTDFMVLQLQNGTQYTPLESPLGQANSRQPYMRVKFKTWRKVFDMSQFDLDKTDDELYADHYRMLNSRDLNVRIDSLKRSWSDTEYSTLRRSVPFFGILQHNNKALLMPPLEAKYLKDTTVADILELIPPSSRAGVINKASTLALRMQDYAKGNVRALENLESIVVRHYNELYRKIVLAVACFLFLFIGAPMGAIVRKGGFGWPILISIIFFVLFLVLSLIGERLSQNYILSPFWGMMLPCFILAPIGVVLTRQAMSDSKSLNMETYKLFFDKIKRLFSRKKKDEGNIKTK